MGKMIVVEGFKAFMGTMIVGGNMKVTGDWLYKPHTNCWYCRGSSYPAECCEVYEIL